MFFYTHHVSGVSPLLMLPRPLRTLFKSHKLLLHHSHTPSPTLPSLSIITHSPLSSSSRSILHQPLLRCASTLSSPKCCLTTVSMVLQQGQQSPPSLFSRICITKFISLCSLSWLSYPTSWGIICDIRFQALVPLSFYSELSLLVNLISILRKKEKSFSFKWSSEPCFKGKWFIWYELIQGKRLESTKVRTKSKKIAGHIMPHGLQHKDWLATQYQYEHSLNIRICYKHEIHTPTESPNINITPGHKLNHNQVDSGILVINIV